MGNIERLQILRLDGTSIIELPSSIKHLINFYSVNLSDCKNLVYIPGNNFSFMWLEDLNVASSLKIDRRSKNFLSLYLSNPNSIESLLRDMSFLKIWIPTGYRLSKSLNSILVWAPNLDHLKVLDLRECNLQSIPSSFHCLSSLYTLNLSGNKFECLPESIIQLSKLKTIDLNDCIRLRSLPLLPSSTSLVGVAGCNSLETLPNRLILDKLRQPPLYLFNCFKLAGNQG